jgi:hypothetical protein
MTKPTVCHSYADGSGRFSMPRDTWDVSTRAKLHELCERHTPASG